MDEVWLVHDDPRIAPLVAEMLRCRGYTVKLRLCESPQEVERAENEITGPMVIRTAQKRSCRMDPPDRAGGEAPTSVPVVRLQEGWTSPN